jgi:diketogulonate reductase-like aldo/keto reductase
MPEQGASGLARRLYLNNGGVEHEESKKEPKNMTSARVTLATGGADLITKRLRISKMTQVAKPVDRYISVANTQIPRIGLGTWTMAGDACAELVAGAIKAGYRHIDTAVAYGNEEAVGQGLREGIRQAGIHRDDVFLTTKVWHDQIGNGNLQRSAESSLKRLDVADVDLLLIHWPNPAIPLRESIAALGDARRTGLAKNIGLSNFTVAMIEEAAALTTEPLLVNQCECHPHLDASKVRAASIKHGMAFEAYTPLGRGATGGVYACSSCAALAPATRPHCAAAFKQSGSGDRKPRRL